MTTKLLSAAYDSAKIADFVSRTPHDARFELMLGRIRLDALLYDRVVLIDADLFDGTFFLAAAHANRLSDLPWASIELRNRHNNLLESFISQFKRSEQDRLNKVVLSSIPLSLAAPIAEGLSQIPERSVSDLKTLAAAFASAGLSQDDAAWYLYAWTKLAREIPGLARENARTWEKKGFPMWEKLSLTYPSLHRKLKAEGTERGRQLLAEIITDKDVWGSRNKLMGKIGDHQHPLPFEEARDVATILTWYQQAYKAAQAHQHGCSAVETFPEENCFEFMPGYYPVEAQKADQAAFPVPPYFLRALSKLTRSEYDEDLRRNSIIRHSVRAWHEHGRLEDLERAVAAMLCNLGRAPEIASRGRIVGRLATGAEVVDGIVSAYAVHRCIEQLSRRRFVQLGAASAVGVEALAGYAGGKVSALAMEDIAGVSAQVASGIVQMETGRHRAG